MTDTGTDHFDRWREDEATAEAMIPILGRLYRENDVIFYIYGRKLLRTPIDIIKAHRYARNFTGEELSVQQTLPVLEAMADMDLDSAKINLGKLTNGWLDSGELRSEFAAVCELRVLGAAGRDQCQPDHLRGRDRRVAQRAHHNSRAARRGLVLGVPPGVGLLCA